ncbi:RNA polymerase sigma factor [Paenibacillus aquistagni]|uniref:RNA polymerase sigma-70 factor, ECF subfamily n=1 Tax=Paenibacillus aquistagni TaxID=1852522 RepID=A0A1X7LJ83_9BACL|nr:sigma-70 family RNA polymerase sigma factor [Paenibacillus aquistagni]SMG53845.1 RNA polymerase sigma-70 factor, ECF subfamily [Paenibacillus aquistagni]
MHNVSKLLLIFDPSFGKLETSVQKEVFSAFNELVYRLVFSYVKNHHSAQDIVQEAFLKAFTSPPHHLDKNKICSWLRTLAKNGAINHLRKQKRMIPSIIDNDMFHNQHCLLYETLEQSIEREAMFTELISCIAQLPQRLKLILYLYCFENLSYRHISEKLSISEGSVRQSLYRARKTIKDDMNGK